MGMTAKKWIGFWEALEWEAHINAIFTAQEQFNALWNSLYNMEG